MSVPLTISVCIQISFNPKPDQGKCLFYPFEVAYLATQRFYSNIWLNCIFIDFSVLHSLSMECFTFLRHWLRNILHISIHWKKNKWIIATSVSNRVIITFSNWIHFFFNEFREKMQHSFIPFLYFNSLVQIHNKKCYNILSHYS